MPPSDSGDTSRGSSSEENGSAEESGEMASRPTYALQKTTRCPNCGNRHVGPYCNECGQRQFGRLTLWRLIRQVVERVFELERGLWPTLRGLTVDPGLMLRRYLKGQRRRYINPASYFFLMAAVFSFVIGAIGITGRGLGAQVSSVLNAFQVQYQLLFFVLTGGVGAALVKTLFFQRLNTAEATAVFLYLMGHFFLAVSLLQGVWAAFGNPIPAVSSYTIMGIVVGWAGFAGYRAFGNRWWPALRMATVPVVWFLAVGIALVVARLSYPTAAPRFETERVYDLEERAVYTPSTNNVLYAVPFGEAAFIADFEDRETGVPPEEWSVSDMSGAGKHFEVRRAGDNQYLDLSWTEPTSEDDYSGGGGVLSLNGLKLRWNLREDPNLAWRWKISKANPSSRKKHLRPDVTSNASVNIGSGLVVKVRVDTTRFRMTALQRTLRYVYSRSKTADSLYVERTGLDDFPPEVSTATFVIDPSKEKGEWQTVRRNIAADYRQAFGEEAPESVDFIAVMIDFDRPFDKTRPDTLRGTVDDLRVYTTPPKH